ncbi:MAG: GTP-binding protein, partial [Oleiphilaceae bacterium]
MAENPTRIPTHLVLGFLGAGKTTAILNLLKQKPEGERWAVLVNEFGEVGIDGAFLSNQGVAVKE